MDQKMNGNSANKHNPNLTTGSPTATGDDLEGEETLDLFDDDEENNQVHDYSHLGD
jgi:hypothetical protein